MVDPARHRVALYTFGLLKAPLGSEVLREFADMSPLFMARLNLPKGLSPMRRRAAPISRDRPGWGRISAHGVWVCPRVSTREAPGRGKSR
jgi:hypothetical protein